MNDEFRHGVAYVLADDCPERDAVIVCDTPELIQRAGFPNNKIFMQREKLRLCLAPEATSKKHENHHELPIDFVDRLPQYLSEPAMILSSFTYPNDSIVIVTDCTDKNGYPIIIALSTHNAGCTVNGNHIACTKLASAYGKKLFDGLLCETLPGEGLLYWNEKKSRDLAVSAGLQLPGVLANHDSNTIIRHYNEDVNPLPQIFYDLSPENYGTTRYDNNGRPIEYTDPDRRRQTFEYTTVLRSTKATLSDGHSLLTEYDDSRKITKIERRDAHDRITYVFSRKSEGTRETSYVYYDEQNMNGSPYAQRDRPLYKSVHVREYTTNPDCVSCEEVWEEYDVNGRPIYFRHNEYGADCMKPNTDKCVKRQYEYDGNGNPTFAIDIAVNGTSITKMTYYTAQEWADYLSTHPEAANGEGGPPIKSETCLYADRRLKITEYEMDGSYTESEYSSSKQLTAFRGTDGVRHERSATRALLKHLEKKTRAVLKSKTADATANTNGNGRGNGSGNASR